MVLRGLFTYRLRKQDIYAILENKHINPTNVDSLTLPFDVEVEVPEHILTVPGEEPILATPPQGGNGKPMNWCGTDFYIEDDTPVCGLPGIMPGEDGTVQIVLRSDWPGRRSGEPD